MPYNQFLSSCSKPGLLFTDGKTSALPEFLQYDIWRIRFQRNEQLWSERAVWNSNQFSYSIHGGQGNNIIYCRIIRAASIRLHTFCPATPELSGNLPSQITHIIRVARWIFHGPKGPRSKRNQLMMLKPFYPRGNRFRTDEGLISECFLRFESLLCWDGAGFRNGYH